MQDSNFEQPSPELLRAFVAGDTFAEDAVLQIVLPQLYRWAQKTYPGLPEDDVKSAIHRVVVETCRPTVRYDPAQALLTTYLIGLITLRLRDVYALYKKRLDHEEQGQAGREILERTPYNILDTPDGSAAALTREQFWQAAAPQLAEPEREVWRLIREGAKDTAVFASMLSRYGPVTDPHRAVKNAKVRLERQLTTIAKQLNYRLEDLLDDESE